MKYKFNPYERSAGLFVLVAIGGSLFLGAALAIKKNWFEKKVSYATYIESAANLREGSTVLMSGLKVGKVERIELDQVRHVKVTFSILKDYSSQITEGAKVQFVRPFILGDKSLSLIPGQAGAKALKEGEVLPVHDTLDLLDAFTGKKLEATLLRVDSVLSNLDETMALSRDVVAQVGENKKLEKTIHNLSVASQELRKVLPMITNQVSVSSEHLTATIANLATITTALKEIEPEGSRKTIELLSESVITLKGMQKSFFLRSNVREVKEEIAQEERLKKENRMPAATAD